MEEEKFKKILEEAGVPSECRTAWYICHKNDNGVFRINFTPESLLFFAKNAVG